MNNKLLIITGERSGLTSILPALNSIDRSFLQNIKLVANDYSNILEEIRSNIIIPSFNGLNINVDLISRYLKTFNDLLKYIKFNNIRNVLLVDNPDFNLILARFLYTQGVNLYYFIIPQIWAWRTYRYKYLRKYFKKLFVIFPFEKEYLKKFNIDSKFVGHPKYEQTLSRVDIKSIRKSLGLNQRDRVISFFPGTRDSVLKSHFSLFEEAASLLAAKLSGYRIVISDTLSPHNIRKNNIIFTNENAINLLKISDFAIISSGSTTMEATFLQVPFIGVYKPDILTYSAGKLLTKVDSTIMPNILLKDRFIPELISPYISHNDIVRVAYSLIKNKAQLNIITKKLSNILSMFEGYKTSEIMKEEIIQILQ